jgi:hypothetical protein
MRYRGYVAELHFHPIHGDYWLLTDEAALMSGQVIKRPLYYVLPGELSKKEVQRRIKSLHTNDVKNLLGM